MGIGVENASMRCKGVGGFGSALLRHRLVRDGARGFGIDKQDSGMVLMTCKWHTVKPLITHTFQEAP